VGISNLTMRGFIKYLSWIVSCTLITIFLVYMAYTYKLKLDNLEKCQTQGLSALECKELLGR